MPYLKMGATKLGLYYPDHYEGLKVPSCHGLLTQLISNELSPESALILAEPVEKLADNAVEWVTPLEGEPIPYSSLEREAKRDADNVICSRLARLVAFSSQLLASKSEQRKMAGGVISRIAEKIARRVGGVRGGSDIFMIEGQPVVTGWGYSRLDSAGDADGDGNLTDLELSAIRKILAGEAPALLTLTPVAPEPPEPPPEEPPVIPTEIAPAPEELTPTPADNLVVEEVIVEKIIIEEKETRPWFACRSFALLLLLGLLLAALLFWLLVWLWDRPQEPVYVPPAPPVAREAVPDPRRSGGLVIPANLQPADFRFLAGCWLSDAGLVNSDSGIPLRLRYCFDDDGVGDLTISEFDEDGNVTETCLSRAKAEMRGHELSISESGAVCQNEPNREYVIQVTTCAPDSSGRAECSVTTDASTEFHTVLRFDG